RTRRMKAGPGFEIVLAPELFAAGGIVAGDHATHTDRYDLAIGHGRRTARPGETAGRPGRAERLVFVLPEFLAVGGVEAMDDFVPVLAGEDEEFVPHEGRCGDAFADLGFPLVLQLLGPGLGDF